MSEPKSEPRVVAVLIGSLRAEAYSRKLAKALIETAPSSLSAKLVEIGDLPLYNEDLDVDAPPAWVRFRQEVGSSEAVLFVTPEYNRSVPAPLKNAIDVGSRPYGRSVYASKPAAVLSHSQGAMGGFGANHALRQSLVFLDMPTLQQPEAYIGHTAALFDPAGALINEGTKALLTKFMQSFADWVQKNGVSAST